MQTFADVAKRYGVYILGSNNQAPFRESTDPAEIAAFADPDLPEAPGSVFVATEPEVYNEVFLWGPRDVRRDGPAPLRNVVSTNKKVPLTPIEQLLNLTPGPSTGPDAIENVEPYALPGTQARISFATSLPAFVYGPPTDDPCADVAKHYMRCLDKLGTNLVMQDEANPGEWAAYTAKDGTDRGAWQTLSWMTSTWRAVVDPAVRFDYNVTPHLVGNLGDLPFDGQTAITQRGLATGPGCNYIGAAGTWPAPTPTASPSAARRSRRRRSPARSPSSSPWSRGCAPTARGRSSRRRPTRWPPRATGRWRTTTSRRRSSPTCRSRRTRLAGRARPRRRRRSAAHREHRAGASRACACRSPHGGCGPAGAPACACTCARGRGAGRGRWPARACGWRGGGRGRTAAGVRR
jgi:hypothetical protein